MAKNDWNVLIMQILKRKKRFYLHRNPFAIVVNVYLMMPTPNEPNIHIRSHSASNWAFLFETKNHKKISHLHLNRINLLFKLINVHNVDKFHEFSAG